MELNISDRVALLNVIPPQGSIVTLRILQDLRMQLSFSEKELKKFKMKNQRLSDGSAIIQWDEDFANETKEIKIGKIAKGIIVRELKKLDERRKLHVTMLSLYERFVEGKRPKRPKRGNES